MILTLFRALRVLIVVLALWLVCQRIGLSLPVSGASSLLPVASGLCR